ncbi:RluA family pseudouridine synthase [Candidatus Izemoplasma sp. B36]|uniref:RluA family pseudouridine synthase n=1 Tax=Candidatus Izemoplasma sp. B36 TaxID=3242468 RepID=UPI0035575F7E
MEMIYRVKKPETILRFMQENNIPSKILELEDNKAKIYVNNTLKSRRDTVKKGDKIHFFVKPEKRDPRVKPEDKELDIVYEDPYLLIINKPSNMQMMISKAHLSGTLANRINHYYEKNDIKAKIHFVTKLDKEGQGLIVVAKHKYIKYLFSNLDDTMTYYFKALVEGTLALKESVIPLPITRVEGSIEREISQTGDECITNYKVIKEYNDYSLVDIWVKNKKAHQIRVHFSYFYCPIIGDMIYGSGEYDEELMLFCYKINFIHPITEEDIHYELDLPKNFKKFIK